jgi:two-component system heavy metal sensor histidine kinase CusS
MSQPRSYSIIQRLSLQLLMLTIAVLGTMSFSVYRATSALYERSQQQYLKLKVSKINETAQNRLRAGSRHYLQHLQRNAPARPDTRLELFWPDGKPFYVDPQREPHLLSEDTRSRALTLPIPGTAQSLSGTYTTDIAEDVRILRSMALILLLTTGVGALAASALTVWVVRQGLHPLKAITQQTKRISTERLGERLSLQRPAAELLPWIDQFNGLMDRVESAYRQLEAFNADVAHEMRTPLTSLIGKTEIALTRERSAQELTETLQSNLEELQRIAVLVSDMLFLSRADRGAKARRTQPGSLRGIVLEVIDFHEAVLAERGLTAEVSGDAKAAVDEPLFKRAVSNLLGNATRFADPGSSVRVAIELDGAKIRIYVENAGLEIAPAHLPRLFDRFYRADVSRQDSESHHGMGLAIVAAIARMHQGDKFAHSDGGRTRVGFSIAPM